MIELNNNYLLGNGIVYLPETELDAALNSLKEWYATSNLSLYEFETMVELTLKNWEPMPTSRLASDTIRK